MKQILFFIHDLGEGGAEKVLVNLVNHLDRTIFEIHVIVLFGGGVNEQFLSPDIHFHVVYRKNIPANSKWMKLFSPKHLHKKYIKGHFDIEVSYLEGPCARVISGCPHPDTRLISWIHVEQHNIKKVSEAFRSEKEAIECYNKFDETVCVSEYVKKDFSSIVNLSKECRVLYNTVESKRIVELSREPLTFAFDKDYVNMIAVGTLKKSKGYNRLFSIIRRLVSEKEKVRLYVLGRGPQQLELEQYVVENGLTENIFLLGYDINPYKYVAQCDLMVCSSFAEGFSTAATEALIVGTPICTVDVSGMKELLGENSEYGVITENDEDALYKGIKGLLDDPDMLRHYKKQAEIRGKEFSTENTVKAVEDMLLSL